MAQNHTNAESLQVRFDRSDVVIEGKIISQQSYFDELRKSIYTKHRIEVYKIFKGDSPNILEFQTVGGTTDYQSLTVSHQELYDLGQEGIFFLQRKNFAELTTSGHAIRFFDNYRSPAVEKGKIYKNIGVEIYEPLQILAGENFQSVKLNTVEELVDEWLQEIAASPDDCESLIEYGIENTIISFPFVEFDITAKANLENLLLSKAVLLLDYPQSLGSNIVENEIISVSKDELIDASNYTLTTTDDTSQKLKIEINGGNEYAQLNNLEILPEPLCHIQIELGSIIQTGTGGFDNTSMQGMSEYYDPISEEIKSFRCVYSVGDFKFNFADFTFFPDILNAGFRDTLSIVGIGFGTDEGKVFLRNAEQDMPSAPNYFTQIVPSRVEWSDRLIQVEIVSLTQGFIPDVGIVTGTPASGLVKLELFDNTTIVPQDSSELEIYYSISNVGVDEKRKNLADKDSEGGYTFHLSSELDTTPNARQVVESALRDWQQKTCVNFKLSDVVIENPIEAMDNENVIFFDTTGFTGGDGTTLMETFSHLDTISPNGDGLQVAWINDIDIIIDRNRPWFIGLDSIPSGTLFDFYAAFSHEIGHAHQLNHVLGEQSDGVNKLMYPFRNKGFESRNIGNSATDGGREVMTHNPIKLNGGLADPPMTEISECSNATENTLYNDRIEVLAYPNPVKEEIILQTNLPQSSEIRIEIFNSLGRQMLFFEDIRLQEGVDKISLSAINLSNGIYYLTLYTEFGCNTIKLIKL